MKIEKINENRIQIIFNDTYLKENNIDVHSFMANSIESQALFLNLLDRAQNEVGFITDNYKLSIEAIALTDGTFIITVTRIEKENLKSVHVHAKRKNITNNSHTQIYKFNNFDDFCNFENFLETIIPNQTNKLSSSNALYKYNNCFFLILQNIETKYTKPISNSISDFALAIDNCDLVLSKIMEYGILVNKDLIHKE